MATKKDRSNDLSFYCIEGKLLRNNGAELLAEFVKLLEHLFAESGKVYGRLNAFRRMIYLVLEVVIEVNCLVDNLRKIIVVLAWVKCSEKSAVVNEFSNEVLDVFFDNSKIHNLL